MIQSITELVAGNRDRVMVDRLKTCGAIAGGCLAVTAAAYARHPLSQAVLGAGALGAGVYAQAVDRRVRLGGQLAESADRVAMEAVIRAYQQALSPQGLQQAIALPVSEPGPIPMGQWWGEAIEARLLLICGPQGSGKTSLALRLLADRTSQGHQVQVLDPHASKGQWPYKTIGAGKDYRAIDAAIKDWIEGVEGHYRAIAQDANAPTPTPQTLLAEELTQREFGLSREFNPQCGQIEGRLLGLMAVSNQPTEQMHEATDGTAVPRVLNLATVLELVNDRLDQRASTGQELVMHGHQGILHVAAGLGQKLQAIVLPQLMG